MTTYPRTRAALFALEQAEAELCRLQATFADGERIVRAVLDVGILELAFAAAFVRDRAGLSHPREALRTALTNRSWVRRLLQGAAA